jgi:hypothetical protein
MGKKKAAPAGRTNWFDDATETPLIDKYARQLDSFLEAMADGRIEEKEIKDQEKRLVKLMKEVEPLLDDDTHEKVTRLLCEMAAYDLMTMLHTMELARAKASKHEWRP